jgi:hypothetical protein
VPAPLHALLDRMEAEVDAHLAAGTHRPFWREVVEQSAAACDLALDPRGLEALANGHAARLFDLRWRRQTLHWAAGYAADTGRTLRIYGRGWNRDPVLAPYAVGPVEHGEPLRRAYRGARLVIQTIPGGFLHQRTFEGLASGSMVIARYSATSAAPRHFPGVDEVQFTDETSFRALADMLLGDAARRRELIERFRAVVLERFTYDAVLRGVLDQLRAALRDGEDGGRGGTP